MKKQGYAVAVFRAGDLHCGFWVSPEIQKFAPPDSYWGVPFVQPLNARQFPPLVFATETEAEIAADFFNTIWGEDGDRSTWRDDVYPGEYIGRAQSVKAYATFRAGSDGFDQIADVRPDVARSLF